MSGLLAKRILEIPPSPTLSVNAKAAELKAQGIDVLSFAVGEPDFDTPVHIRDAAKKALDDGQTRYTPVPGTPELRKAIAEKFKNDNGLEYSIDQITVNCGGKHSFYNLCQAILDPGDEVIVPAPYWVSYPPMVMLAEGKPIIVPTTQENQFKPTRADLEAAITSKTKALVLNSPSNPTGSVFSSAELDMVADLARQHDFLIISDDIYEMIMYDGLTFDTIAGRPGMIDRTLVLNGVSKTYAMTGWRIGYMAGPEEIIKGVNKIQSQSTSNPNSIAQAATIAGLRGPQDFIGRMLVQFKKRRDYVLERLNKIDGVSCHTPGGAFYVFPKVDGVYGGKAGDLEITGSVPLAEYLLSGANIAIVPGAAFGDDACIRISYATALETIEEGLNRLEKALKDLS
ncbi:MAG: pyridoxal phosphate-dependent aminotransferase [Proteobacteria bacterium]|nr:pyridoxal phosphate-dependent aminotransferase [Pseudomonadota bacterium]